MIKFNSNIIIMKPEVFKFPTLRGLVLSDAKVIEISEKLAPYTLLECGKTICFAKGRHITHEGPNGGIFSMGEKKEHNMISFEIQTKAFDKVKGKTRPMYLLVWVGGYTKGAIFHCGWQYPHAINFDQQELFDKSKEIFKELVNIFYNNQISDKEILNFIKEKNDNEKISITSRKRKLKPTGD
jgi:hypothetical protein